MKERISLSIKLITSHLLLLPIILMIGYLIKFDTFLILAITQVVLMITFTTGYWEFFGQKSRVIYAIGIESLILILLITKIMRPEVSQSNSIFAIVLIIILGYLFFELIKIIVVILRHEKNSVEITFPLKNGTYLITDGGNSKISRLMNYHYYSSIHKRKKTNNSMKFATDIVKIGIRRSSYLPLRNEEYPIFGEKVFCPISGTVVKVINDINDNSPFSGNYPYNSGNTIVIKNENNYLLIGHLKKGSISLNVGDIVHQDDPIAESGNSGFSERPHIHMQLINSLIDDYWQGLGIGITFQNKNLYKNRLIEI